MSPNCNYLQVDKWQLSAVTVGISYSCLWWQFAEITVDILHLSPNRHKFSACQWVINTQNSVSKYPQIPSVILRKRKWKWLCLLIYGSQLALESETPKLAARCLQVPANSLSYSQWAPHDSWPMFTLCCSLLMSHLAHFLQQEEAATVFANSAS